MKTDDPIRPPPVPLPDPEPEPMDDDRGDDGEPTLDEAVAEAVSIEENHRSWIRACIGVLKLRSHGSDPSARVQLADDLMHIAVCERVARLMHSDLPAESD